MSRSELQGDRLEGEPRREGEALDAILGSTPDGFWLVSMQGQILDVNEAACRMLGYERSELLGQRIDFVEADETVHEIAAKIEEIRRAGSARLERRQRCKDGRVIDVELSICYLAGAPERLATFLRDVSERRSVEALLHGQTKVLERIAAGADLAETLDKLLRVIESQSPEMLSSLLLLDADGLHLRHVAAPSLPKAYLQAIDGIAIGPSVGSCGTAAFRRQPVIVEEIATDPLWIEGREAALAHGLHSCWSTPIFDAQGNVLGTFAMYYRRPGRPSSRHQRLIEVATQMAAIAISRERADESRRRSETKFRTLYDSSPDGVLLLDEWGILDCNPAALKAFGCRCKEELCSKHPSDLSPALQASGEGSRTLAEQRIAAALSTGTQRFEWLHRRADTGEIFPAEVLLNALEIDGKGMLQAVVRDITERKRAEEALYENEDRYRDLLDNSLEIISTCDLEGNLLSVNATAIRFSGFSEDALLKMNLSELIAPEVRHLFADFLQRIVNEGGAHGFMRIQTASGERRYWEFNTSLRTEGVSAPVIRGMALDITDRRKAEIALRASNERFELANRATFDVIWDWNLATHAFWRNDNFRALFGYDSGEVGPTSDSAFELVHAEDRERVQAGLTSALEGSGEYWADRYRFRRRDGSYATVEDRAIITRNAGGRAVRLLGAMQDVSERAQAEAQLILQSGALEAAANTIVITDRKGLIEWANQAFTAGTGYSLDEALGKRPGELIGSGRQDPRFYGEMWTTILGGEVWRGELVNRRKDGSLYTEEMTITPLKDAAGGITHFVAVKQDVTQHKLLEAKLRQAERIEAVGRLAGGVAHDFNNMLGVILGFVELALGEVDPAAGLFGDLVEIQKAARRSAELTRQLLSFARQETIAPRPLDLNDAVPGMLGMLRRLIGESIAVTWEPGAELWRVKVDPSQIDQIVANLCVNARDAIAGVGSIAIATANSHIDEAYCALNIDAVPGDYVRLTVSDTGSGMDEKTVARIFEPFFTTKAVGEGTGLGLATVYGAVKQNMGFIVVSSEIRRGTTFEVYLPRHAGESEAGRPVPERSVRRGHETILLVEDEAAILRLTQRALEAQGYSVLGASGPREAARLASEYDGEIDLLLTDVVMPEMNGRDLAHALAKGRPRIRRLYMSGYAAEAITEGGVLEEGVAFIQKPFSLAEIAIKVRQVLDRD